MTKDTLISNPSPANYYCFDGFNCHLNSCLHFSRFFMFFLFFCCLTTKRRSFHSFSFSSGDKHVAHKFCRHNWVKTSEKKPTVKRCVYEAYIIRSIEATCMKCKRNARKCYINIARQHQQRHSVNEQSDLICLYVVLAPQILCKHVQNNHMTFVFSCVWDDFSSCVQWK